jgi:hypothetical protein
MARTRWSDRVAYHEAGHAVSALVLGLPVAHVRLGPVGHGSRGAALTFLNPPLWFVHAFARWYRVPCLTSGRRRYVVAHIVNSWAGWVAERRYLRAHGCEPPLSFEGSYDWDAARRAQWMCRMPDWAIPRVSLRRQAERIIHERWPCVVVVAETLLAQRMLSGAGLAALIPGLGRRRAALSR